MEKWTIDSVDLNVANLENMTDFYTRQIGLKILNQTADMVELGADTVLLRLYRLQNPKPVKMSGLYHFALLVPERKVLAEIFVTFYHKGLLDGASDHGYSEALYLNDPEGNGIEIYCDKPQKQWDIRENGQIEGVTEQIDVQGLTALASEPFEVFPDGTKMGHVHLMVRDLQKTQSFYNDLGFDLKSDYGSQAKFFAKGLYHHHVGANTWHGLLPERQEDQMGVRMIHLNLNVDQAYETVDPSGIKLSIKPN